MKVLSGKFGIISHNMVLSFASIVVWKFLPTSLFRWAYLPGCGRTIANNFSPNRRIRRWNNLTNRRQTGTFSAWSHLADFLFQQTWHVSHTRNKFSGSFHGNVCAATRILRADRCCHSAKLWLKEVPWRKAPLYVTCQYSSLLNQPAGTCDSITIQNLIAAGYILQLMTQLESRRSFRLAMSQS